MEIIETGFEGLQIIHPSVFEDNRGYFFESYNRLKMEKAGIPYDFIQDNEACSDQFVFRGFHYQLPPFGQVKLVRVVKGKALDIVIDIRPNSPTFGRSFTLELSATNKVQLLVPEGFAHGYLALENNTIFSYKVNQYYHKASEQGIIYNDPHFDISWPVDPKSFILSEKDLTLPDFKHHVPYV